MKTKENNHKRINRVMIAAAGSGSGKTLFTCGLLNLLNGNEKFKGKVRAFKCGPDYIDPMFHRQVIGVPSENLDSFFLDEKELKRFFGTVGGEYSVIEGVMGIYDGISLDGVFPGKGSCYEVASITRTPIILLIDCKGIYTTLISLIKGILSDDTQGLIKGIILNRASQAYFDTMAPAINKMIGEMNRDTVVLGFLPHNKNINLESRHLGLKLPHEIDDLKRQLDYVSEMIQESCDVDSIIEVMELADESETNLNDDSERIEISNSDKVIHNNQIMKDEGLPWEAKECNLKLAVARDEAFCFYYEENLRQLKNQGIEIVEFSPVHDRALPENIQGILIGGGYPELFAKELSENKSMKESIASAIENGMPSLAECGGFMFLMEEMEDPDGIMYPMVGVIEGESRNTGKLSRFGYIEIESKNAKDRKNSCADDIFGSDNVVLNETEKRGKLLEPGSSIKAHEFHYYDSTNNGEDCVARKARGNASWNCIHMSDNHLWGYPHLYYASLAGFVENFKEAMIKYRDELDIK